MAPPLPVHRSKATTLRPPPVGGDRAGRGRTGRPAGGEPVDSQPVDNQPAGGEPVDNQPAGGEPVDNQPAGGEPVADRPGHYFDATPAVASRRHEVTLALPDATVALTVDRGVFSAGRVDPGTLALLRSVTTVPATGAVLDLGCGYGPIAVTLARRAPGASVWAVDVNERAVGLAGANARQLGLGNVTATTPDDVPTDLRFAAIWSNPPIRIGNPALRALLDSWLARLEPTGEAWLVVQRHLGADSLAAWLATLGWTVRRHASKQGYRILHVQAGAAHESSPPGQGVSPAREGHPNP